VSSPRNGRKGGTTQPRPPGRWGVADGTLMSGIDDCVDAVARYRLVPENGTGFCSSESSADYSRDEFKISEMHATGMLDEDGKPVLGRARMTEDQVNRQQCWGRGVKRSEPATSLLLGQYHG
jgi:hypothetical protein